MSNRSVEEEPGEDAFTRRKTLKIKNTTDVRRKVYEGPFFVVVEGGVCQYVGNDKVDLLNTRQAELIDLDNLEADPTTFWEGLGTDARKFFKVTYPDAFRKYKFEV